MHPIDMKFWDLPQAIRLEMTKASMRIGSRTGHIGTGNAKIVTFVFRRPDWPFGQSHGGAKNSPCVDSRITKIEDTKSCPS